MAPVQSPNDAGAPVTREKEAKRVPYHAAQIPHKTSHSLLRS